jgi:hypothetical protein
MAKRKARASSRTRTKKAAGRKGAVRRAVSRRAAKKSAKGARSRAPRRAARPARRATAGKSALSGRGRRPKPAALDRERRKLTEEDMVPMPPSTLDFDRKASQAASGRAATKHQRREHTETGPDLTAGDIDADWGEAYADGDEAPGGDNPTPDQDVVEEIGRALGVEYDDAEELKGSEKIIERDRNRWEYDPASAEDYRDRNKKQ